MSVLTFGLKGGLFLGVGLVLAIYLQYPPPKISRQLLTWVTEGSYFIHKDHRLFYKDSTGSDPEGPVLVCLHGFPSFSYDWIKLWPDLQSSFGRVIAPDFLGFGYSDKPQNYQYSLMEQADIVESLLVKLGVSEVHLLSHDYGDTVGQELLARYNERSLSSKKAHLIIKSLCLLNGGIFPETNFPRITQRLLLVPYLGSVLPRLFNQYTFNRAFGDIFGPKTRPTTQEFKDFWAAVRQNDGNLVLPNLLDYINQRRQHRDRWTGALQNTRAPLHMIYGPADPVNPPGFVNYYEKTVPFSSITVLESHIGHYPQWEDPEHLMQSYETFLKSIGLKVPTK